MVSENDPTAGKEAIVSVYEKCIVKLALDGVGGKLWMMIRHALERGKARVKFFTHGGSARIGVPPVSREQRHSQFTHKHPSLPCSHYNRRPHFPSRPLDRTLVHVQPVPRLEETRGAPGRGTK